MTTTRESSDLERPGAALGAGAAPATGPAAGDAASVRQRGHAGGSERRRGKWAGHLPIGTVVMLVVGVGTYGGAKAYDSIYNLARRNNVGMAHWVPVGFEASLAVAVLTDIVFTWREHPVWYLRWVARIFIVFSVVGNGLAGWPNPVAVFLSLPPPVIVAVIVESARHVLLRKLKIARAQAEGRVKRDRVPLVRWLLAPAPTFFMWRRMVMWGTDSYREAIRLEITRLQARRQLRVHYERRGKDWTKDAPDDLVWMLKRGIDLATVTARVAKITNYAASSAGIPGNHEPDPPGNPDRNHAGPNPGNRDGTRTRTRAENRGGNHAGNHGRTRAANCESGGAVSENDLQEQAWSIAETHFASHGGMINQAEFARQLHRRKRDVADLHGLIKAKLLDLEPVAP